MSDSSKQKMTDDFSRRGLMLVLSSPSGAGKTTLSRMLLEEDNEITMSVSATTRPPRKGETHGEHYYFVDKETFGLMVNKNELLEHAKVFENYYGTPRGPVEDALVAGKDVLFDIDWQGTQQLQEASADDLVRIFILPPSAAELESRLKKRAQDSFETVTKRMAQASDEISHYAEYDYIILNEDIAVSHCKIMTILKAERLKRVRQTALSDFIKQLRASL